MKVRHAELEECLRDPRKWVAAKFDTSSGGPRPGYDYCLREGIYHLHKTDDAAAARTYIERTTSRRKLGNRLRLDGILTRFDLYLHWFEGSGLIVADHRSTLSFDLGSELILGGTVSRLDITSDGYRAILLASRTPGWQQEIRMPLIQRAMAVKYGRPEDELSVGYQGLDGTDLEVLIYSQADLDQAESVARQLAETVSTELLTFQA